MIEQIRECPLRSVAVREAGQVMRVNDCPKEKNRSASRMTSFHKKLIQISDLLFFPASLPVGAHVNVCNYTGVRQFSRHLCSVLVKDYSGNYSFTVSDMTLRTDCTSVEVDLELIGCRPPSLSGTPFWMLATSTRFVL
jgi:hypothetical protein